MMKKLLELYQKYKEIINYLLTGGVGTVVSIGTFALFIEVFGMDAVVSNVISWVIVVILMYILNRYFVFTEHAKGFKAVLLEILAFFGARVATLLIETAIVWLGIDVMNLNAIIIKTFAQIVVIVLNYVASKLVIFKKRGQETKKK